MAFLCACLLHFIVYFNDYSVHPWTLVYEVYILGTFLDFVASMCGEVGGGVVAFPYGGVRRFGDFGVVVIFQIVVHPLLETLYEVVRSFFVIQ